MTNSTDKKEPAPKKPKVPKKKGPIRFEAIVPIVIILTLGFVFFTYFFDSTLRKGIEWTGTFIHGAEVNVGSLRTSFLNGTFKMSNLQITDKEKPERNIVKIGEIRFGLLWDALLRAKFVINEASVEDIQALAPRKRPGYVVPEEEVEDTQLKKLESGVLDQAKSDFSENVLGDVANVLGGTEAGQQIKDIQGQLKAETYMKELEASIAKKEQDWQERFKSLPQKKEVDELVARSKKIKLSTSNPKKFAKDLKELQKIIKEGDELVKAYKKANKDLNGDIKGINNSFKDLDKIIKADIQDLQTRFNIPNLDVGSFSKGLFGRLFAEKMATINKYKGVVRKYMPPPKTAEEKAPNLVPRKRGEGKTYKFPVTVGYPLFWLKKAVISSDPGASEYSGKIRGEITDVTSNPVYLGRPTLVKFNGDFPKQGIFGIDALVTIDHTTDKPVETAVGKVGAFPVNGRKLSDSESVKFSITKAKGSADFNAKLENNKLDVKVMNYFKDLEYLVEAKSPVVQEVLEGVARDIPVMTVDARAKGKWDALRFSIKSNIGDAISKGFKKQVDAQISKAKAELQKLINDRIGGERAKLESQLAQVKNQLTGQLDKGKKAIEEGQSSVKNQLNSEKKSAKKAQKKKLKKQGDKLLKDLGKKLKF